MKMVAPAAWTFSLNVNNVWLKQPHEAMVYGACMYGMDHIRFLFPQTCLVMPRLALHAI